jgi:ABC-2 type transport system ATP-binding protein
MIRVENLKKSYGEVHAVASVSFQVSEGQVVGLLGPNGAGKSTTMRIMTGFLYPDSGSVEIDGIQVDPEDPRSKAAIGYLPESTPLYGRMCVAEYLDFIGRIRGISRAGRRAALPRVLADCALEGWEKRRIGNLSKGYRQRVGLAQALYSDPKVLVLDEPTSGLDPSEIARMRELIARLGETKTVLLSTHVLAEVQETCKRVIILAGGRVVADGSPLDLAEAEQVELHVTLMLGEGGGNPEAALLAIDGVSATRPLGTDDSGRRGIALSVDERWLVAERVSAEIRQQGWTLLELRHDLPSLERVFLSRTESKTTQPYGEPS